jgi:hypothetical protein
MNKAVIYAFYLEACFLSRAVFKIRVTMAKPARIEALAKAPTTL